MKNNVISIFVDSVAWETIGNTRTEVSATPFLDSLVNESITASKLYSHGPYTDAAKTSLFTGRNCLDDFGYFFRENSSPITDFKLFHNAGYETYCFSYPFWLYGKNIRKFIDHQVYTAGFVFASEWNGMFKYYSDISKTRALTEEEEALLTARFELFFDSYRWYLEDMSKNGESAMLYGACMQGYDFDSAISTISDEYCKFKTDKSKYIAEFNQQGMNHVLAKLDTTRIDTLISRDFLEQIVSENRNFFRTIKWNNIKANWWRSMPSLKRFLFGLRRYIKTKDIKHLNFCINYILGLTPFDVMRKRWGKPKWQNDNSIHTILEAGIKCIENRKQDKPFYMYLNTDDPHNDIAMFAYDTQDKDEVNDEIRVLKDFVNKVNTNFKGNLLYFLSLRYVDYEIEKFCNKLKNMELWNSTTLLVLSDHGSSYTFHPLHNARVNCFDDECYHIPVLMRHPGLKGVVIDTYQNSKDIFPTVCDLVGIEKPKDFTGHSMLDRDRPIKDYVMTEYMGPGCPDMTSRRMWLSIRDKNYIVAYKVGIYELFEEGELAEVYDLKKDPDAIYNINYKINRQKIDYLLSPLKIRYEEIKRDSNKFISDLKKGNIIL